MKLLADTHAFLWFITDSPRLSLEAKTQLESADNDRLLSVVSLWEIAIKTSLGKLTLHRPLEDLIPEQLAVNSFNLLGIAAPHALQVAKLPFHHRDPFDRMLVAQSLVEHIPLVSNDAILDAYGIQRVW